MSEQQFNIIFRGDIVFGCQLTDVKLRLQQLFKTDEAKINALFTGKPIVIKRNLDLVSAEKYRDALLNAGAHVDVVVIDENEISVKETHSKYESSAQKLPKQSDSPVNQSTANWSLAPVGVNLLNETEQHPFVARDIDTSTLHLRPTGGNLLDANELQSAEIVKVTAPDFKLANVGADLLRADEKLTLPLVEVTVDNWDVAELGADMITEEEKEIVPSPVINVPDVDLAPAGVDLGQIKPSIKPVAPDISGIHLVD